MTMRFFLAIVALSIVSCREQTTTPVPLSDHPATTGCAACHHVDRPSATTAVGAVTATATTPGWKFYHTEVTVGATDCETCHTNNYVGQAGGWAHGNFPHVGIVTNCILCHQTPTSTISKVETTPAGRNYTVHFHNLNPTGFNEDPGAYNDCSTCHTHAAGWSAGNFGPSGGAHLTDSLGNQVTTCTNCHDYPANFWRTEHTTAQSKGYDCKTCHLTPGELGGTQPGGFGDL